VLTMEIENVEVTETQFRYDDSMELRITVDEIPERTDEVWTQIIGDNSDNELYVTTVGELVKFFANPQTGGAISYGEITTDTGETVNATSAWSSRRGVVNYYSEDVEAVEVKLKESGTEKYRLHQVTLEFAQKAIEEIEDYKLEGFEKDRDVPERYYRIVEV